jgi:hypothetical protein
MNNSTTSKRSLFIIAAALLTAVTTTTTVGMVPAAYAGGDHDDDDDHKGDDNKNGDRYDGRNGDGNGDRYGGNEQQIEDESTGALADCDNTILGENARIECHASTGLRFTGQDVMINGISKTLLSDKPDPSPQTIDSTSQITSSMEDLPLPL